MNDRELTERWIAYCRLPRLRPLRGYYALWGHEQPVLLPDEQWHKGVVA